MTRTEQAGTGGIPEEDASLRHVSVGSPELRCEPAIRMRRG
jgi:hypothetical protein